MMEQATPRKMFHPSTAYDISVILDDRKHTNLALVRVTARVLRRRERQRRGLPPEHPDIEEAALNQLLSNRQCLLARGEIETVARMACDQLTRAGAKPALRLTSYYYYAPFPDNVRIGRY